MKQTIICIMMLTLIFTPIITKAETIRHITLGTPILNIEDDVMVRSYPAALQIFPDRIWVTVDPPNYNIGGAWIFNPRVGLSVDYTSSSSSEIFNVPTGYWSAGAPFTPDYENHISVLSIGSKLNENLFLGMGINNTFPGDTTWGAYVTQTIDGNGKVVSSSEFSGFTTRLTPSAVVGVGDKMKIYGVITVGLNFLKYLKTDSHGTNKIEFTPDTLSEIGIRVMPTYELNDKILVGAQVLFSMQKDGYSVESTVTNKKEYSTNYIGNNPIDIGLTLGTRIKPDDNITLFFTLPLGLEFSRTPAWENTAYHEETTFAIPVLQMGAEVRIIKNLKLRCSAKPEWYRTFSEPKDNTTNDTETHSSFYNITTALGLGYKTGRFIFDAHISDTWFTQTTTNPLRLLGEIFNFNYTGTTPIFAALQVTYVFGETGK